MSEQLLITSFTSGRTDILVNLMQLAHENQCNITESRATHLHSELVLTLLLAGKWDAIVKMESAVTKFAKTQELQLIVKRVNVVPLEKNVLAYTAHILSIDKPGIIYQITQYFNEQKLYIHELFASSYLHSITQTQMLTITMTVFIPADLQISELRENFIIYCDTLNVDAILEPDKS